MIAVVLGENCVKLDTLPVRGIFSEGLAMLSKQTGLRFLGALAVIFVAGLGLSSCGVYNQEKVNAGGNLSEPAAYQYDYTIGPGDGLQIFVWRNPELSHSGTVRPDGKISSPLVEDMLAGGKTSTQLARDIEGVLSRYVRNPQVTVMVVGFRGVYSEQIRVVGQATTPQALPYRAGMTLLDVMIAVGGLTQYASGNRAKIVRSVRGQQREIRARLEDLIQDGDISANLRMAPGDVVIIPEAWF